MSAADRQATIEAYQEAIALARSSSGFIEQALNALLTMADALMQVQDGKRAIEALTDDDFKTLEKSLPGAVIFREEIAGVKPDVPYFARLAARLGDAADRAFIAALSATRPESVWPVYLERQTDYSGCTRFGSLALVRAYRDWSTFAEHHPGRYVQAAKNELDDVSQQLTGSTCACGNAASVRTELERFIRDFGAAPIRSHVEQRLDAVKQGRSEIRMNCVSG
jgi:hypothetical protein